jgi:hypothetical protein
MDGGWVKLHLLGQLQVVTRDILPKGLKFRFRYFRSIKFPFWSIHLPKMLTTWVFHYDPQFVLGRRILLGCSDPFDS